MLAMTDGRRLIAPGELSMIFGPSGCFKSWLRLHLAVEQARESHHTVLVDYELSRGATRERLAMLGANSVQIATLIHHLRPGDGLLADAGKGRHIDALADDLRAFGPGTLVVIDSLAGLFQAEGLDVNSNSDARRLLDPLQHACSGTGAALLVVHHTGHGSNSRPKGAEALRNYQGTYLAVRPVKDRRPAPGKIGEVGIHLEKDNLAATGLAVGSRVATMVVDSTASEAVRIALRPSRNAQRLDEGPPPLAAEVRSVLEDRGPQTTRQLRDAVRDEAGAAGTQRIDRAVGWLRERGQIVIRPGHGNAKIHEIASP